MQPQDGADQRRGDIKVSKHGNTWILDVGVGTQRYVDQGSGTTPGHAAEAYAAVKAAKYADQDNFIPFILETGGRVNKAARDWLDALTAHYLKNDLKYKHSGATGTLCHSGRCQHRRHHGILQLRFQLDSDVQI